MSMLAIRFLEEISELINMINEDKEIALNPATTLISAIFLTFSASFSLSMKFTLTILFLSLILSVFFRVSLLRVAKLFTFLFVFIFFIYIPHIVYGGSPYIRFMNIMISMNGLTIALKAALRTAVASVIFLVFLSYLGWRNLALALNKFNIPKSLIISIIFFIKYLPIHIKSVSNMLFARESRLIKRTKVNYWRVLASVAADLLIKSNYQAKRFYLGLKARNFETFFTMSNNLRVNSWDIMLLITSIVTSLIGFIGVI